MARKEFLQYVWDKCIEPQLGYSFSVPHDIGYSLIGWQEVNLFERFNPLFWSCACLNINSGNIGDDEAEDYDESDSEGDEANSEVTDENNEGGEEDASEEVKSKRIAPDYKKIAKAICEAQLSGIQISLPDINSSQSEFYPDIKNNAILYSLSAINSVGDNLYDRIINCRPYSSMEDFIAKVEPTEGEMFGLIKAGCFDRLLQKSTSMIVHQYAQQLAEQKFPLKTKATMVDLKKMIKLGFNKPEFALEIRVFKYKLYISQYQIDKANKRYLLTDDVCIKFFNSYICDKLNPSKDEYGDTPKGLFIKESAFERVYKQILAPVEQYINTSAGLQELCKLCRDDYLYTLEEKYFKGTPSKWQFDTMCFYHDGHELKNMRNAMYNTVNFEEMPELPTDNNVYSVAGTVIGANNIKHIVSILTNYGVVEVKLYTNSYTQYNQKISVIDPKTKKKTVLDDSWFKRGNKIIIYGQRKENVFVGRPYRGDGFPKLVGLIEGARVDGTLSIRYTRNKKKEGV